MQECTNHPVSGVPLSAAELAIAADISTTSLTLLSTPAPAGRRHLNATETDLINRIRDKGDELYALIKEVHGLHRTEIAIYREGLSDPVIVSELNRLVEQGQHWRSRATDSIQDGLMQLIRAVARPNRFS